MKVMKKVGIAVLVLLLLAGGAATWVLMNYHVVDFKLYRKDAKTVDLRGQEVSVELYKVLAEKMPEARIRWDVPFQGGLLADDVTEVTVETLTEEDVQILGLLQQLQTVHADNCRDYPALEALRQLCPEVEVDYSIHFTADSYRWDTADVILQQLEEADPALLPHLPNLKTVVLADAEYDEHIAQQLQGVCHNLGLEFGVLLGGTRYLDTETDLTVEGITSEDLALLPRLHTLQKLHLKNPEAPAQEIFSLGEQLSGVEVSWEVEIAGATYGSDTTEVDLTQVVIEDLALVEKRMAYLPKAEKLILGLCGIDNPDWGASKTKNLAISAIENEDLAAYRDRVREQYKVVWTVRLGPSIALRTDADNFMPNHFGVGQLFNDYAYNLRYCEDMVCLDVGHMTLTDISFVTFMPKLKYLILAWTEVQYIEPIRTCKNLVFLELDNSCIRDYSPLVDCTALEDLNIGKTFCNIEPILEMTWLKNLYMIFGNGGDAWRASQALPDTRVVASGDATVGSGWRRLPNYYDMRDCLGMYYMN